MVESETKENPAVEEIVEESPVTEPEATEEQLEEAVPEVVEDEAEAEELSAEETEEETEEEEAAAEEAEAPAEEETADEPEATDVDTADKALDAEMEQTEKELFVVKEMREELAVLYARNNELESEKEQLSSELNTIRSELGVTKEQLQRYIVAEEKLSAKKRHERVEKLSKKFEMLGQKKTVEQLSAKDDETLAEYEKIVDVALDRVSENKAKPAATAQSQSAEALSADVEDTPKSVEPEAKVNTKKAEQLSNDAFFSGLCKTLTSTQETGGKRVLKF